MVELLRLVINEKGCIDKEELRKSARKYYQYNNNGKLYGKVVDEVAAETITIDVVINSRNNTSAGMNSAKQTVDRFTQSTQKAKKAP